MTRGPFVGVGRVIVLHVDPLTALPDFLPRVVDRDGLVRHRRFSNGTKTMVSVVDVRGGPSDSSPGVSGRGGGKVGVMGTCDRSLDPSLVGSGGGNYGLVKRTPGFQSEWVGR